MTKLRICYTGSHYLICTTPKGAYMEKKDILATADTETEIQAKYRDLINNFDMSAIKKYNKAEPI